MEFSENSGGVVFHQGPPKTLFCLVTRLPHVQRFGFSTPFKSVQNPKTSNCSELGHKGDSRTSAIRSFSHQRSEEKIANSFRDRSQGPFVKHRRLEKVLLKIRFLVSEWPYYQSKIGGQSHPPNPKRLPWSND